VAGRIVQHPAPTLVAGVVVFGGLAFGVFGYTAAGFGGNTAPPGGTDSAAGQSLLARHFPQSSANPTSLIFRFSAPVWQDPGPLAAATRQLQATGLFTQVAGPLNPVGAPLTPAEYSALHARLGPGQGACPPRHRPAAQCRSRPTRPTARPRTWSARTAGPFSTSPACTQVTQAKHRR